MTPLMETDTNHKPRLVTLVVTVSLLLIGCGVSGKSGSDASASTTQGTTGTTASTLPETIAPETTDTTQTTVPEGGSGDTTIPGSSDTTIPDPTNPDPANPFGTGDIKRTLIQIYKRSGFTDKEANCVADLIVKESGGGTIDPSKLDVLKLGAAARRCFGADGVPGGND